MMQKEAPVDVHDVDLAAPEVNPYDH